MSRTSLFALAVAFAGCALAGRDNGNGVDAPPTPRDAPRSDAAPDAPRVIDASIDAAIDAAPQNLCTSGATCAAATALNAMYGDEDADVDTASGYQEAWYQVRITEEDDGIFGVPMTAYVVLNSPATAQYDLFLYLSSGASDTNCTSQTGTVTTSGQTESQYLEWGEDGTFSNGDDDSRTLAIEVRPRAGAACTASAPWTLTVYGDY